MKHSAGAECFPVCAADLGGPREPSSPTTLPHLPSDLQLPPRQWLKINLQSFIRIWYYRPCRPSPIRPWEIDGDPFTTRRFFLLYRHWCEGAVPPISQAMLATAALAIVARLPGSSSPFHACQSLTAVVRLPACLYTVEVARPGKADEIISTAGTTDECFAIQTIDWWLTLLSGFVLLSSLIAVSRKRKVAAVFSSTPRRYFPPPFLSNFGTRCIGSSVCVYMWARVAPGAGSLNTCTRCSGEIRACTWFWLARVQECMSAHVVPTWNDALSSKWPRGAIAHASSCADVSTDPYQGGHGSLLSPHNESAVSSAVGPLAKSVFLDVACCYKGVPECIPDIGTVARRTSDMFAAKESYIQEFYLLILNCSLPTEANWVQSPAGSFPYFRKWESCRTVSLVGGFSGGFPVPPALAFWSYPILTSFRPHKLSIPIGLLQAGKSWNALGIRRESQLTEFRNVLVNNFVIVNTSKTRNVCLQTRTVLDAIQSGKLLAVLSHSRCRLVCGIRSNMAWGQCLRIIDLLRCHPIQPKRGVLIRLRLAVVENPAVRDIDLYGAGDTHLLFLSVHCEKKIRNEYDELYAIIDQIRRNNSLEPGEKKQCTTWRQRCRGGLVGRLLSSHPGEFGSSPGAVVPGTLACGNCAGRCRWSAGYLGDLPFPPPLHSCAAPYSPRFTLIGSQDLDVESRPSRSTALYRASEKLEVTVNGQYCGVSCLPLLSISYNRSELNHQPFECKSGMLSHRYDHSTTALQTGSRAKNGAVSRFGKAELARVIHVGYLMGNSGRNSCAGICLRSASRPSSAANARKVKLTQLATLASSLGHVFVIVSPYISALPLAEGLGMNFPGNYRRPSGVSLVRGGRSSVASNHSPPTKAVHCNFRMWWTLVAAFVLGYCRFHCSFIWPQLHRRVKLPLTTKLISGSVSFTHGRSLSPRP
ncbi:hypothetical protein PR048_029015 [Dryococelus australis]|uniref:Uncharacterized protein n=1 Tax=Dryococelus australis TaxID=614101 RepID=A0ABQ9GC67_9NEOP|nr:hypothetical protein PR048_029015 [Dryococelus australis]